MAKKKRGSKKRFKKLLEAGKLLALAPFKVAMISMLLPILASTPGAWKPLRKKLKKKKLKDIVKMFMQKVIKKKHFEQNLATSFDFEYAFGSSFEGDHLGALDELVESSLEEVRMFESLEEDHFVQAIADILKTVLGFFKGLSKKNKKNGGKGIDYDPAITPDEKKAEKEALASAEKGAENPDEEIKAVEKKEKAGFDPKMLLMIAGGLVVIGFLTRKK